MLTNYSQQCVCYQNTDTKIHSFISVCDSCIQYLACTSKNEEILSYEPGKIILQTTICIKISFSVVRALQYTCDEPCFRMAKGLEVLQIFNHFFFIFKVSGCCFGAG